jgi:hypothetical protein
MTANIDPSFTTTQSTSSVVVTAANTKSDGTGTIGTDIFKAGGVYVDHGGYVLKLRWIATASSAATTLVATVARIFISSQSSGSTTSADTYLWEEISLPRVTAASSTSTTNYFDIPLFFSLPPGYTILVTNHTAPTTSTAWCAVLYYGDFAEAPL